MDWKKKSGSSFGKESTEHVNSLSKLVSEEILLQVSQKISRETHLLIDNYRKEKHLSECKWNSYIQAGADLRGKEILSTPKSIRPNGKEGMDAPYDFGYSKEKFIQLEVITSLASDSLKWLIKNGAQEIFYLFLKDNSDFLLNDDSTEDAVGIYIAETTDNYFMGAVYLAGKDKKMPNRTDRSKLVEAYNYSIDLVESKYSPTAWGKMMLAKADAFEIYRNKEASQKDIDQAVKMLLQTFADLRTDEKK